MEFAKPKLVVSRCFFEHTRYDGGMISSDIVKQLEKYCDITRICPEVEIGLPIPREPIDVFLINGQYHLMNKSQSMDLTEKMIYFSRNFAMRIKNEKIDGMILKAKSPSCGLNDAKLYGPNGRIISKTAGLFAKTMIEQLTDLAIESEMRLTNDRIRFEFLTFIFTLASFRKVRTKRHLIEFHSINKFLLLTKNEKIMREMGKLVAQKRFNNALLEEYKALLIKALRTSFRSSKVINTLLHIYGYFKEKITSHEKSFFMELIEDYKNKIVNLQTLVSIIKSWALRYNVEYILMQTFLEPYPKDLEKIKE
ncbi:MAG: DUF523 and DUF1722 domain-containing protein [Fervidobacterium sp.]|nr:DUF523 and DUF1722 domain-containing protein [Fervidobacterium sp.]